MSFSSPHGSANQKKVFAVALDSKSECAKHGKFFAAQKQSVCSPDAKTTNYVKWETTEVVEWMIPGIYLSCRHGGHRVAKKENGPCRDELAIR